MGWVNDWSGHDAKDRSRSCVRGYVISGRSVWATAPSGLCIVEGVGVSLHEVIPFAYQYQAYVLPVINVEQTLASLVLLVDWLLGGGALATLALSGRGLVTGPSELVCSDAVCGACSPPSGGRGRVVVCPLLHHRDTPAETRRRHHLLRPPLHPAPR